MNSADYIEAHTMLEYALEGNPPTEILEELEDLRIEIDRVKTENEKLIELCMTMLRGRKASVSKSDIERQVESFCTTGHIDTKDINKKFVVQYLETQFSVQADTHTTLDEKFEPWIKNKKGRGLKYWTRYVSYLLKDERYAPKAVEKLDEITDDILDHLKDPTIPGEWDKRGLVVGHVQSGKTSNYLGLICKAADLGYKLIIVLGGVNNDLRAQTQFRIDKGFLGFDTQIDRTLKGSNVIGVGYHDSTLSPLPLTTSELTGDFRPKGVLRLKGKGPVILVVKKHPHILTELIKALAAGAGRELPDGKRYVEELPLLLIDDEADNASINVSKDSVSKINGLIRSFLLLFQQSAYVGYTATPFANVFIPLPGKDDSIPHGVNVRDSEFYRFSGDDLFPRDFIINIPPPSNYIGPKQIFGIDAEITGDSDNAEEGLPIIRKLLNEDYESYIPDKHKNADKLPNDLPPSLKEAILCFILSCAIRRTRGQIKEHNSMLVHVTSWVRWQNRIANLVSEQLKFYQGQIDGKDKAILSKLKEIWKKDYVPATQSILSDPRFEDPFIQQHEWFEIEAQLYKASSKIEVRAIHGGSKSEETFDNISPLDYYDCKDGLSVIAVGGNKLSRGLTLEGLTISYYLRATKMYDTLMQMGRWFGYRPGYLDLCRLYTSEELVNWYRFITVAADELRADFEEMKANRQTPRKFGLKVRQHPGVLQITAANKFRQNFDMELSFSDRLRETSYFRRDKNIFDDNYSHTRSFINSLGKSIPKNDQKYVWEGTGNYKQVISFLEGYTAENNLEHQKLIEYIKKQADNKFLTDWTIVLITTNKDKRKDLFNVNSKAIDIGLTMRADVNKGEGKLYAVSRSHIIDPKHEFIDFDKSSSEYGIALEATKKDWRESKRKNKSPEEPKYPSGKNIRAQRSVKKGLLLIYPLDPKPEGWTKSKIDVPIIGYAISFPKNDHDVKLIYSVNKVFKEEYDYPMELIEDEAQY